MYFNINTEEAEKFHSRSPASSEYVPSSHTVIVNTGSGPGGGGSDFIRAETYLPCEI